MARARQTFKLAPDGRSQVPAAPRGEMAHGKPRGLDELNSDAIAR